MGIETLEERYIYYNLFLWHVHGGLIISHKNSIKMQQGYYQQEHSEKFQLKRSRATIINTSTVKN